MCVYIYIHTHTLDHSAIQLKLAPHCKSIIINIFLNKIELYTHVCIHIYTYTHTGSLCYTTEIGTTL